jgi:glutathione S-transferase
MSAVTVYGPRRNPFVDKVLRALALKKLDGRLVEPTGPEDYRRWNPETGLLPVATIEGQRVIDSHRILDALDERWPLPGLVSPDPKVAGSQRRLEVWASQTFYFYWERWLGQRVQEIAGGAEPARGVLARFGILRRGGGDGGGARYAVEYAQRLADLANFLGTRPFFYADQVSRADLAIAAFLESATVGSVPEAAAALEAQPALVEWLARVAQEAGSPP